MLNGDFEMVEAMCCSATSIHRRCKMKTAVKIAIIVTGVAGLILFRIKYPGAKSPIMM